MSFEIVKLTPLRSRHSRKQVKWTSDVAFNQQLFSCREARHVSLKSERRKEERKRLSGEFYLSNSACWEVCFYPWYLSSDTQSSSGLLQLCWTLDGQLNNKIKVDEELTQQNQTHRLFLLHALLFLVKTRCANSTTDGDWDVLAKWRLT